MDGSWHLVFAWWPVATEAGTIIWLEHVGRRWWNDEGANYAGDSSRWLYIEAEKAVNADA